MVPTPPLKRRSKYRPLAMLPMYAAMWSWMSRFIHSQVRAENVWRQRHGMLFCHMPISQAEYLTESIDRGRE